MSLPDLFKPNDNPVIKAIIDKPILDIIPDLFKIYFIPLYANRHNALLFQFVLLQIHQDQLTLHLLF